MDKIGVLTSGGDAPGMNAAVRAVTRKAIYEGLEIIGIKRGYTGVIESDFMVMDRGSVADIIHRGGTMLHSARCEEFRTEAGRKKAIEQLKYGGIEGLIVIGGDGSFKGAQLLSEESDIKVVGVPATIDNDIACTDYSIGYDTAMNTILDAINKIRDTATSHERTFVVETMGRHSGILTLMSGLAGGAESILVPEIDFSLEEVCEKLNHGYERGKLHSIILVAEGIEQDFTSSTDNNESQAFAIAEEISNRTGFETRVTVLGHLQRGGIPTAQDRILGSRLGAAAVDLLLEGETNKMVGVVHEEVKSFPIEESLTRSKDLNKEIYKLADILSL
ncbi:6-phosphofructokinase [Acetohalobium arabaticum]|uniref:ATP-dependent 6-phosphofructokinase n=1 Tax=Acetohalobium arabaticum (strain ATCC 49924 / DSM 5501 / Z-7288) TaxID=574087 RepID=D9QS73_ACEAZ|nr:6-phosphofructokinase [Acetohalobium arabaticum]ADL13364.1 6-phosphofructokinase [Acetohalobium arabaticum DSM 5501]